jgi:tryptophan synthase alpha chain
MAHTLAETFRNLKRKGRKALIPYIMGGDPDIERSELVVRTLVSAGADVIELGIPFSDPLADGPAIQEAGQRAIRKGVTCEDLFKMVARLRKDISVPIVFMTYYNPVFHFGLAKFCNRCAKSGVSGLIVPDLPLEESLPLEKETRRTDLDLIYLATPTSPPPGGSGREYPAHPQDDRYPHRRRFRNQRRQTSRPSRQGRRRCNHWKRYCEDCGGVWE